MEILRTLAAMLGLAVCVTPITLLVLERCGDLGFSFSWRERATYAVVSILFGGLTFTLLA